MLIADTGAEQAGGTIRTEGGALLHATPELGAGQGLHIGEAMYRSSTAREARGLRLVAGHALEFARVFISNRVIRPVTDNRGLASRAVVGLRDEAPNGDLRRLFTLAFELGSRIGKPEWRPRTDEAIADADARGRSFGSTTFRVVEDARGWLGPTGANLDQYADEGNKLFTRFCRKGGGEGSLGDALRYELKETDVPWMFPPPGLAFAAVKRWYRSASAKCVYCVPRLKDSPLRGLIRQFGGKRVREAVQVEPPQVGGQRALFDAFVLTK